MTKHNIISFLCAVSAFSGASYAAPHHFSQCELIVQGVSMKGTFPNGEAFEITYDPVESLETHCVNFERDPLKITGSIHTVEQFSDKLGTLLNFSLFMGGPSTMNDGLNRYLAHRGVETNGFVLETPEIKEKSMALGQNFGQALFHTIYNAPQNVSLITYVQAQGLDPESLHATQSTFVLNNSPINTLGAQLTELTLYSALHVKDAELSETDSD